MVRRDDGDDDGGGGDGDARSMQQRLGKDGRMDAWKASGWKRDR